MKALSELREIERLSTRIALPEACSRKKFLKQDKYLVAESLFLRTHLLLDLGGASCSKRYRRALMSLNEINAKAYFLDVKMLREYSISKTFRCLVAEDHNAAFKQLQRIVHYKWMVTAFPDIWEAANLVSSYKKWIQWVSFDTKLNLLSADYTMIQTEEYLWDEWYMSQQNYDEQALDEINLVIREWYELYYSHDFDYHLGLPSGATLDLKRKENTAVTALSTLENNPLVHGYMSYMYAWESDPLHAFFDCNWSDEVRPMKLDFVPKSPLTNRLISIDQVSMTVIQKDMDYRIRSWLRNLPLKIDLTDQDRSKRLALRGSRFGNLATIDLSKASDSITCYHIVRSFSDVPLLPLIMYTRNPRVTFSIGQNRTHTLQIEKFAPMGNSLCFSMETIFILAACEVAFRRVTGRRARAGELRVYGDDIVIRSDVVPELFSVFSGINLKINENKSFWDQSTLTFREACGIEAINGIDITPVRFSRKQTSVFFCSRRLRDVCRGSLKSLKRVPMSPEQVVGCIAFANRCQLSGLLATRKAYMKLFDRNEWFYNILRVDETDYRRSELLFGSQGSAGYPTPFFVVPDGTATNFRCSMSKRSCYTRRSEVRIHPLKILGVRPYRGTREEVKEWLSTSGKDVDELSYLFWTWSRPDSSRSAADSLGDAERLSYFGRPVMDFSSNTETLYWDWTTFRA